MDQMDFATRAGPQSPARADPTAASFEAFVQATGPRLYRTAVLLCGDHHLAEDLTQTAYAKIFASWRRVARAENPVAYARTVLTRTFISDRRLRRNSERPTADLPEGSQEHDSALRLDLLTGLRQLSADDRLILVLRFWEDLSVAQTAEQLGIRDAAVRQRSTRALARLRIHLPDLAPEQASEQGNQS